MHISTTVIGILLIPLLITHTLTAQHFVVEGDGYFDGKLGIGIEIPPALLSIRSAANDTEKLLNFGENNNLSFFFEAGFLGTGVTGNTLKLNTFGNNNSTNAMTWRADGNIGIGALNPGAKLHIPNGTSNTGVSGGFILLGSTTVGQANLGIDRNSIQSRLDGGTTSLSIQPFGGNVGIGVDDPDERLEVDGSIKINGRIDIIDNATNIFIGRNVATSGSPQESVVIGYDAGSLLTNDADLSTFVGKDAGRQATSGLHNAVFGGNAAEALTTQGFGTYIGTFAGSVSAADDAVFIGYDANSSTSVSNAIAVGSHSLVTGDNRIMLGNAAQTEVQAYSNLSMISDRRFKKNIQEDVLGLDFVMALRPVTYQLDARQLDQFMRAGMKRDRRVNTTGYDQALQEKSEVPYTGFVAQEVEAVADKLGFAFSGVVKPQHNRDHYGLRYAEFVVPLVKGMQDQQQQILQQKEELNQLRAKMKTKDDLIRLFEKRLATVESLLNQIQKSEILKINDATHFRKEPKLKAN